MFIINIHYKRNMDVNIIFEIEVRKIQSNRCFIRKTRHPYQKRPAAVTCNLLQFHSKISFHLSFFDCHNILATRIN